MTGTDSADAVVEAPMRPLGTQEEVESLIHERVTADDISRVVARMTGIPVQVKHKQPLKVMVYENRKRTDS